jgi:threonine/homoserine/homoserine lactone efflux protein
MFNTSEFIFFALASFMLNITPGADMLYVATRSTSLGVKAGVVSALGIMTGCIVHLLAAVLGLSAIIASSALAFSIVKYAGAGYLIYLGINSYFSKRNAFEMKKDVTPLPLIKIFRQGVVTNVLNPKVALFFLAFLPQFIHAGKVSIQWQILMLGSWFNLSGTIVNILVAVLFGKMGNWLAEKEWFVKWQQKITGLLLFGLGIKVALQSRK